MAAPSTRFQTVPAVLAGILSAALVPTIVFLFTDPHAFVTLALILGSLFLAARYVGTSGDRAWLRFWAILAVELVAMMVGGMQPPADAAFVGLMLLLALVAAGVWGVMLMARRYNEKQAPAAAPPAPPMEDAAPPRW